MIKLTRKTLIGQGVYGRYFRLSQRKGVKVVGRGCHTEEAVYGSTAFVEALKESEHLCQAARSGLAPKFYELVVVRFEGKFYPGIIMEHLVGKKLNDFLPDGYKRGTRVYVSPRGKVNPNSENLIPLCEFIKYRLRRVNVRHNDLHGDNIYVNKDGLIRVIDFSPDHSGIYRK